MKSFATKFAFLLSLAFCGLFSACSDDNPFAQSEDALDDMQDEAYWEQQRWKKSSSSAAAYEACYYGTSTRSNSWCCYEFGLRCDRYSSSSRSSSSSWDWDWYYSSSSSSSRYTYSSSSSQHYYLTEAKVLYFTLTYYKQEVKMDGIDLYDGDPEISFSFTFTKTSGATSTATSGTLLDLQETGYWSGTKTITLTVPSNTETISVCPKVIDEDVLFNDDYSSGYCYNRLNVGYLDDYETVYQTDSKNTNLTLKWKWYLY